MPINSIDIVNFQPHKSTYIKFCDGMNVITGTSDIGKSSILKAFLWVKDGRPLGDVIKNWDSEDDAPVIVRIIKDGNTVTKIRQNGVSWYEIKYPGSDKIIKLEAVKTNVPQEVTDIFNLKDINIQTQHEPYLLINMSPGQAADKLNEFSHLDIIGVMYKNVNKKITAAKQDSERKKNEAQGKQKEIDSLSFIEQADEDISVIEKLEEEYEEDTKELGRLCALLSDIQSYKKQISSYKQILNIEKAVGEVNKKVEDYQSKKTQINLLKTLLEDINQLKDKIASEKDWLCVESHLSEINDMISKWNNLKTDVKNLKEFLTTAKRNKADLSKNKETLDCKKAELTNLLKKEKRCPLCFNALDSDTIKRIVQ